MSGNQQISDTPQSKLDAVLRRLLKRAIRKSPMSPEQICDELTSRIRREISTDMLQNWRSPSKSPWRLPADCVAPLAEILHCDMIPRVVMPKHMRARLALGEVMVRHPELLQKGQVATLLRQELKRTEAKGEKKPRRRSKR